MTRALKKCPGASLCSHRACVIWWEGLSSLTLAVPLTSWEIVGRLFNYQHNDTTPKELTDDYLREMSASELVVADNEEKHTEAAVPENKWTVYGLAEGVYLFTTAFDFFYDMDPSMTPETKIHNRERIDILQKHV